MARAAWFAERFRAVQSNVEGFIKGKSSVVHLALVCLMAEGHLLIEDIPGVGKTSLAKAIANSIDGSMSRIQFTPDLVPSDVFGAQIWNTDSRTFEFRPGPVFSNILLGDEINRASPKTQSALLEMMEERQVTVDGTSYVVPRPSIVMATQNPADHAGTYDLPEGQRDRFMMRISMGYPKPEDEVQVIQNRSTGRSVDEVRPVIDVKTAQTMARIAGEIHVAVSLYRYVVAVCSATRKLRELRLGVSPRGSLALVVAAQAYAASQGRQFVTADDVKALAPYVLVHRMLLTAEAELAGNTGESLLQQILTAVPVPDDREDR